MNCSELANVRESEHAQEHWLALAASRARLKAQKDQHADPDRQFKDLIREVTNVACTLAAFIDMGRGPHIAKPAEDLADEIVALGLRLSVMAHRARCMSEEAQT